MVVVGTVMKLGKVVKVESTMPAGERRMMLFDVLLKVNCHIQYQHGTTSLVDLGWVMLLKIKTCLKITKFPEHTEINLSIPKFIE